MNRVLNYIILSSRIEWRNEKKLLRRIDSIERGGKNQAVSLLALSFVSFTYDDSMCAKRGSDDDEIVPIYVPLSFETRQKINFCGL